MGEIKLPELPGTNARVYYTRDEMREYAKQAAELERERCAEACDAIALDVDVDDFFASEEEYALGGDVARRCAAAIRGTK